MVGALGSFRAIGRGALGSEAELSAGGVTGKVRVSELTGALAEVAGVGILGRGAVATAGLGAVGVGVGVGAGEGVAGGRLGSCN